MGNPKADDEALWRLGFRASNSGDFVRDNGGLGFALTERAQNLSGGQRAAACPRTRACSWTAQSTYWTKPQAISTGKRGRYLREAAALAKSKIVLFISHRLSSVRQADRIFVLERGLLCESGTHDALLALSGVYARLWQAQAVLESFAQEAAV